MSGEAQERSLGITRWMRSDPSPPLSVPVGGLLIALLLAAAAGVPAASDTVPPAAVAPEAPATLLPLKIGDAGVDISIAGSWSALVSFGAGMLTGAVLGALGGAGIARGMNMARGKQGALLRWDDAFLSGLVGSALLRYLAVAHYGRGRGEWTEGEYPPFWQEKVAAAVAARSALLANLWARRNASAGAAALADDVRDVLAGAARSLLDDLYPGILAKVDSAIRGTPPERPPPS